MRRRKMCFRRLIVSSWLVSYLRQNCEHPDRELPEVRNIDRAVAVVIKRGIVIRGVEERLGEQPEVGDIDVPVAVDVAEEAVEALGVAEGVVVSAGAVAVAVERLAVGRDLIRQGRQSVPAILERTKFRLAPGKAV